MFTDSTVRTLLNVCYFSKIVLAPARFKSSDHVIAVTVISYFSSEPLYLKIDNYITDAVMEAIHFSSKHLRQAIFGVPNTA